MFEITMRYWNYCNKYDTLGPPPGINGDYAPVTITAIIRIITSPPEVDTLATEFCYGSAPASLEVTVNPDLGISQWYLDSIDVYTATPPIVADNNTFNPATDPDEADDVDTDTPGIYRYWVTAKENECESSPTPVDFIIRNQLSITGPISGPNEVCEEDNDVTFSLPQAPDSTAYGGETEYVWDIPAGWSLESQSDSSITVDIDENNTGVKTLSVTRRYTTSPECETSSITKDITVNDKPELAISAQTDHICHANTPQFDFNLTNGSSPLQIIYQQGGTNDTLNNQTDFTDVEHARTLSGGAQYDFTLFKVTDDNGCVSDAVPELSGTASVEVREELVLSDSVIGPSDVCSEEENIIYSMSSPPATMMFGQNTRYQWSEGDNWLDFNESLTQADSTIDVTALAVTGSHSIRAYWRYETYADLTSEANTNFLRRCPTGIDSKLVDVHELPNASLSEDTTICNGDSALLTFTLSGESPFDVAYNANGGVNDTLFGIFNNHTIWVKPTTSTDYQLQGLRNSNDPFCENPPDNSIITVTVNELPTVGFTGHDTICEGDNATITFHLTGIGPFNVRYFDGSSNTDLTGITDGHTISVSPTDTTFYELVTVESTGGTTCSGTILPAQDSVLIVVDFNPTTSNAGLDSAFCADTVRQLHGNNPIIGTGLWTLHRKPSGSQDPDIDFPDQRETTVDIVDGDWGEYTFKWTISSGVCPVSEDTVVLDFGADATDPDAGVGNSTCFPNYTLNGNTPTVGTPQWSYAGPGSADFTNDADPNTDVTVDATGDYKFYWSITSGACPIKKDSAIINFYPNPISEAGSNAEICELDSFTVSDADTTNCNGTFTWSASSVGGMWYNQATITPTYKPGAADKSAGSVKLYLQVSGNGDCDPDLDSMILTISAQPSTEAGLTNYSCSPSHTLLGVTDIGSGTWSLSGPGSVSNWGAGQNEDTTTVTIDTYGEYKFFWTETNGSCTDIDSVTINFYEMPTATAGPDIPVCGDTVATLQGVAYTFSGGANVDYEFRRWFFVSTDAGDNTPIYSPDNTSPTADVSFSEFGRDTLYLYEENTANCVDRDTMVVILSEGPTADIPKDSDSICGSFNYTLVANEYVYSGANDGTQEWTVFNKPASSNVNFGGNENNASAAITVDRHGLYTFIWTEDNGNCSSTDTIRIYFYEQPAANIPLLRDSICGSFNYSLIADDYSFTGDNEGQTLWALISRPAASTYTIPGTPTNDTINISVDVYGVYSFEWIETNGTCEDRDTIYVHLYEQPTANVPISRDSICGSQNYQLNSVAFGYTGENEGQTTWSLITKPTGGTYTLGGAVTQASLDITVDDYGAYSFEWIETNGTCEDRDTIYVHFYEQPTAIAGDDDEVCNSKSTSLDGAAFSYAASPNDNEGTRTWEYISGPDNTPDFGTPSSATSNVTVDNWGQYEFRFTETNGICSDADTVMIYFYQQPSADAGGNDEVCNSKSTILTGSAFSYQASPNQNFGSRLWEYVSGPDNTPSFSASTNDTTDVTVDFYGTYQFKLTETNGTCTASDIITVVFYEQPTADAGSGGDVCASLQYTLDADEYDYEGGFSIDFGTNTWSLVSNPTGGFVTNWGTGIGEANTTITVNTYGTYEFAWTETNGTCNEADTIIVTFWRSPSVNISNDGSICQGFLYDFVNSNPTASYFDSLRWTFAGGSAINIFTGTLEDSDSIYASYLPGIDEAGDIDFKLNVYGQGNCPNIEDTLTITINPSPSTPAISGDPTICVGDGILYSVTDRPEINSWDWSISTTSGAVPPNVGNLGRQVYLSFDEINPWIGELRLQETGTNTCKGDTVTLSIQSYEKPTIEAGLDINICEGGNVILGGNPLGTGDVATGGSADYRYTWSLIGTGNDFLDNAVIPHPTSSPTYSATFRYNLRVDDDISGCVVDDTIEVTLDPRPNKPVCSDAQVCDGLANPDLTATGSNITWFSDRELTTQVGTGSSYTPTDSGAGTYAYYATQTVAGCESLYDSAMLYIRPNPTITVQQVVQNQTVCESNDGIIEVDAVSEFGEEFSINGGTSWESSGYFPNLGTDYYFVAAKNLFNCITYGDTLTIASGDEPPAPNKEGTDASYCFYQMDDMDDIEVSSASGGGGILFWVSDGDTTNNTPTISPDQVVGTKTYRAYESKGGCTSLPTLYTITVYNETPVPDADDLTVCYTGEITPDLYAEGDNIEWYSKVGPTYYNVASGNSYNPLKSNVGTYEYYVTQKQNGCSSAYFNVTLKIKARPDQVGVSNKEICYGEPNPIFNISGGSSIQWYGLPDSNIVGTGNNFTPVDVEVYVYEFYVTQTNDGCESYPYDFDFEIKYKPTPPVTSDTFTCSDTDPKPLLSAVGDSGSTIYWYVYGDDLPTSNDPILIEDEYYDDTSIFEVTQTINSCESEKATATRIVYPQPGIPTTDDVEICFDEDPILSATGETGATIQWYNDAETTELATGNSYNTGQALVNSYPYKVRQEKNTCASDFVSVDLIINSLPLISAVDTTPESDCVSEDGTVTITASDAENPLIPELLYSIYGDIESSYEDNSGNFTNLSNGFYPTVVKNQYGCKYFGDTAIVRDGGAPATPTAGNDAVYCANASFVQLWSSGAATYSTWYRNNMSDTVAEGTNQYTPDNIIGTTTYWVTEKSDSCESNPAFVEIIINALPEGNVTGTDSICQGESADITIELSGEPPFNFVLKDGNGNDEVYTSILDTIYTISKSTSGNYHLYSLSDANSCTAQILGDTATITVTPLPAPYITPPGPHEVCKNEEVTLNGNPSSGTGAYVLHKWTGDTDEIDRTDSSSTEFESDFPTTYELVYSVTDQMGCIGTDTISIIVNNNPSAGISPPSPAYVCEEENLQLNGNPSGGQIPYTHQWTGDVSGGMKQTIVNPVFNDTSGTYELVYTVTDANGCFNTDTVEINVNLIDADITQDTIDIYVNEDTVINGNPYPPEGNYEHTWTGNTGFVTSDLELDQVTFNSSTQGQYSLTYEVEDTLSGCVATDDVVIIVSELPATYITPDPGEVCAGIDLDIRAHTTGGTPPYIHSWTGDTEYLNTASNTDVTFNCTTPGTYNLTYTVTDARGQIATDDITISVYENPVANMVSLDTVCAGDMLDMDGDPTGGSNVYPTHDWRNITFGADIYLQSTNTRTTAFISSKPDIYGYIYQVNDDNGCTDQDTIYINNLELPDVDFNLDPASGCSPLTVNFENTTSGADSYTWDFGDDSTSTLEEPEHTYMNRSNQFEFFVKLTAISSTNQCVGSKTQSLKVYPELTEPISVTKDSVCSENEIVNFNGFMNGVSNYAWKIDGVVVGNDEILSSSFENSQIGQDSTVIVQLIRSSNYNCKDTTTKDIVVHPLPTASFTVDISASCTPLEITITNTSVDALSSIWDFDRSGENETEDNNTTIDKSYENATSRRVTKTIELVVQNEHCKSEPFFQDVSIYPAVFASFELEGSNEGCSPLNVDFINNSTGIDASNETQWDFGDGDESNQFEPEHDFENGTGSNVTYTVQLNVSNSYGCVDSTTDDITVYPGPLPGFEVDRAVRTYPDTVFTFTNTTEDNNYTYSWDFDDGSSAVISYDPGTHSYSERGSYTITLSAINSNSNPTRQCPNDFERDITLKWPPPLANFDTVVAGCAPYEIIFNNTSEYALSYLWDINEGQIAFAEENPTYTFIDTGFIPVRLTAYGEDGMTHDTTKLIRVYPQIVANFSVIPRRARVKDDAVGFFPALSAENVESYLWNFGDDSTSTERNPQHIYMKKGYYNISLEVWNRYRCYNKKEKLEEVFIVASDTLGFPTVFIPNPYGPLGEDYPGTTTDQMFYPVNIDGVEDFTLEIYNRWGVLIRRIGGKGGEGEAKAWDGYGADGKIADQDVYVWKVIVKYKDGNIQKQVGTITLLR
ncbi:PKD domain-containing protein [Bacteroidota bacterium]